MCLFWYLLGKKVVGLAFHWVETALLDLLVDRGVTLVHGDHQRGDDAQIVESCDLFGCGWAAIKDPAVRAAIWLFEACFHQVNDELVREGLAGLKERAHLNSTLLVLVVSDEVLD
jgi:hypothetical protein